MVDLAGGHPSNQEATAPIADLQAALATDEITFHPDAQYRHILVAPADWAVASCIPPHDLTDQPAVRTAASAHVPGHTLMACSVSRRGT